MRTRVVCVFSAFLGISAACQAGDKIFVQVPALLDPAAPIVESVKRECGVELLVGNHVFQKVNERIGAAEQIQDVERPAADKILRLTILSVQGVGGGAWSGAKAITIRADVTQGGQVLRSTVLRRQSRGGAFGGMSGTCTIIERVAIALGEDVAGWLAITPAANPGAPLSVQSDVGSSK